jgi:hypothetical protein
MKRTDRERRQHAAMMHERRRRRLPLYPPLPKPKLVPKPKRRDLPPAA